tara:strand:+ start:86003 stop:86950 length:948 start_codon:yes stop_codon:yes gene_type:complete
MLTAERRAALEMRLQGDDFLTKQAAMEKVAAYKDTYGWLWPLAAEGDEDVAEMRKEAFLGMAARFIAGKGRQMLGAAAKKGGEVLTRYGRTGGAASQRGQRMIRSGEQTVRRGRAQVAQAKRARHWGISQRQADVLMSKHTGPKGSAAARDAGAAIKTLDKTTRRSSAKAGNRAARKNIKSTLERKADASYKPTVAERISSRVGSGAGGAGERRFLLEQAKGGGSAARAQVRRDGAKSGLVSRTQDLPNRSRDIYGRTTREGIKSRGAARVVEGVLDAPTTVRNAASGIGSRLSSGWRSLTGRNPGGRNEWKTMV